MLDSSAFVVLSHYEIDASGYSFPYVARWAKDKAVLRRNLAEGRGIPVAVVVTGANRHDMTHLASLLDATVIASASVAASHLVLDRGYDYDVCREAAIARG